MLYNVSKTQREKWSFEAILCYLLVEEESDDNCCTYKNTKLYFIEIFSAKPLGITQELFLSDFIIW